MYMVRKAPYQPAILAYPPPCGQAHFPGGKRNGAGMQIPESYAIKMPCDAEPQGRVEKETG